MKTALLIIDATPTFMPGGELPVPEGDKVIAPIERLMLEGGFDAIVDVREEHPANHKTFCTTLGVAPYTPVVIDGKEYIAWPPHAEKNKASCKLHPALRKDITHTVLKGLREDAECYGGFAYEDGKKTRLEAQLRKMAIGRVVIVGLALDYCVGTTALQAAALGYQTSVVLEACKGVAPQTSEAMLKELKKAGVQIVESVDEIILEQKILKTEAAPFFI